MPSEKLTQMQPESHARAPGATLLALCSISVCGAVAAAPPPLPVPCAGAACGAVKSWVTSGSASLAESGNRMNITQTSSTATLNWQNFDIAAGHTVNFIQPSANSVALNQIFEANPSQIFGTLTANGQVYLLNPNGLIFGPNSVVNVGSLVASSLAISQAAINNGIAGAIQQGAPAFEAVDANGNPIQNLGVIDIQSGASITANGGGEVLIFAPTVTNEGTIQAPTGQAILGAGQRIFLSTPLNTSSQVRGLLIEVGGNGTVTNGTQGEIVSTAGDVTLAGLAVNQMGRVSATTTIESNGSIELEAQATTTTSLTTAGSATTVQSLGGYQSGTLVLGTGSSTDISLQGSTSQTTVDATAQPQSDVELDGGAIEMLNGASIVAPHGNVTLNALGGPLVNPNSPLANLLSATLQPDSSRIWLAPGSTIDVSGDVVSQSASLNSLAVELNGVELADSPQQRTGPLLGQTVYVDIRQHGVTSDGTSWVGTPMADLSGDVAAIQQDVFQRSLTGGSIALNSSGSVIVSPGATLNVSGGQINWQAGYVKSSILVGANGQLYPIAAAPEGMPYVGTLDSINQSDPHWGSTADFTLPGYNPKGIYQPAYVQGMDAGTVSIVAPGFVLDGNIEGGAVRGPLQINPATPISDIPAGELYRYADEVPLGGQLVLGQPQTASGATDNTLTTADDSVLQGLTFAPGAVLSSLTGPSGGAFDPSIDPLPSGFVSSLRPDLLGSTGVTRLEAYAEGSITVPAGTELAPGPGGSVTLVAGEVNDSGAITTSEGSVTLESLPTPLFGAGLGVSPVTSPATQLYLAPGASIDVSGVWVNQEPSLGQSGLSPLFIKGGSAQFLAPDGGSLVLSQGSSVNVSGGAQRDVSGSLIGGSGGSITVTATPATSHNPQGELELGAALSAFALDEGGSLAVTLPALCVSSVACSDSKAYRIDPSYLTELGFGDVSLASDNGGLTVAQDVDSAVRQLNLEFASGAINSPSAASLAGLTTVVTLPEYLRDPENLSLSSSTLLPYTQTGQALPLGLYADLTIAQGASLDFDPQATVSLTTNSRIFMDGSLIAPSGSITLDITGGLLASAAATVLGDQAIWLGPTSTLDTSGTVVLTPNKLGLQLGNVLPGGTVSIDADRGYLLALPGSSILAAGTSAVIDESSPLEANSYQLASVASAGGSIELQASEGMQLDGTLAAPAGAGGSVSGGTLSLTLDGDDARSGIPSFDQGNPQLDAARTLTVTASAAPTVIAEGASVPDFLDGQGQIAASTIRAGGFDNVDLTARDLVGSEFTSSGGTMQIVESVGTVAFDPGVTLAPRASLVIDAPQLSAASGKVSLSSAYIALGSDDPLSQQINNAPVAGSASLSVTAQLIDLVGAMDLNGFGGATLSSSGDIRAVGVQLATNAVGYTNDSSFSGLLVSPGALTLNAQQIYPTTLTSYDIDLTGATAGQSTLTLTTAPGTAGAVLSAAGSLTVQANQILDSGVLRAPMGTISLVGETLTPNSGPSIPSTVTLSSGAVVSVSTDGLTIPFGETQGGLDWVYVLRAGSNGDTVVYGTNSGDVAPPQKQVTVTADNFQLDKGATIDVSGGGDLVAYEFTPGLGGNNDVLSTTFAPNTYAVIPGLKLPYAPIDPNEDIGFAPSVGSSVYLSGGNGLPAGTYALLPARYALLPGAYLVSPVSGYTNLAAGQSVAQADGSVVVSGYQTVAGTGIRASQTSGWDVVSGSYAYQEAQYTLTSANTFFAAQATANSATAPQLPQDAGTLAIQVGNTAQLAGSLLGSPADGGRGATLDLTATNLYIGADAADAPSGVSYVTIDPAQVDALGADSIVLGATSSVDGDSTDLTVGAQNLVIGQNTDLTAPEIILAASGALDLESGAEVNATGATLAAEPTFSAPAGTALVRASTGSQVDLTYTGTEPSSGAASLTVAQGALVSATGSMSFDTSGTVDFSGSLSANNASVRLSGDDIALGTVPTGFNGFAISAGLLGNLSSSQLTLDASAPVAVYGPVRVTLNSVDIAAPGIDVSQGGALEVSAGSITLGNPGSAATADAGTGSVALTAAHVVLEGGTFTLSGAGSAAITASDDLTATGSGSLVTGGSLTLTSPVMQSAAGTDYAFTATGALTTALATAGGGKATSASGPGGALSFTGSSVELGGNIVLPGGQVEATAETGDVTVADGATIDVAGFSETFDSETESAGGGTVGLSSATGNVTVASTAVIDVSAGSGGGAGGELDVSAPSGIAALEGKIDGGSASGQSGGTLSVEAQSLDFGSLVALTASGGFSGAVDIHERGSGDFLIGTGTTLQADDVELTADQGSITVDGTINASNALGGTILLAAQNNVEVSGTLSAGSPTSSDRGGTVELDASDGGIFLDSGSKIDVGGAPAAGSAASNSGTVWLRTSAQNVLSVLGSGPSFVKLDGTITGAGHVYLEGYTQVAPDGTQIDSATQSLAQAAASGFMSQAMPGTGETVAQALGQADNPAFSIVPGIEIDSPGNLTVSNTWDFSTWRYGPNQDIPGVLTIRTGGSLTLDPGVAISDGFDGTSEADTTSTEYNGFELDPAMQTSWSYRLAAGANLSSANPLAVITQTELATEQAANPASAGSAPYGSVYLSSGGLSSPGTGATDPTMIRTGTGSIDIAAAGDLELGNQASVIYTAGAGYAGAVATGKKGLLDKYLGLPNLIYPVGGGNVSIDVGQDLIGATSNQLFNDWLWRSGESGAATPAPVSWLPKYDYFEQGIGALGGGDLTIHAGGNIVDLGANVPSSGIPEINASGGVTTTEVNAGILRVTAGGNIEGGKFLDLAGQAYVTAGGQVTIGSDQAGPGSGLYPVLAVGSGQFTLAARQDLSIDAVVDPTLLSVSSEESADSTQGGGNAIFSTYGDTSSVTLTSVGGQVTYLNRTTSGSPIETTSTNIPSFDGLELEALPPTLQAIALGGNVTLDGTMVLWPSAHGNLNLLAAESVFLNGVNLSLSDVDPSSLPGVVNPSIEDDERDLVPSVLASFENAFLNNQIYPQASSTSVDVGDADPDAPEPVHGGAYSVDGAPDTVPARVVALGGDVTFEIPPGVPGFATIFNIAKPIDIVAGGDIVNPTLFVQQYSSANITNVVAGGSIIFPTERDPTGSLLQNSTGITIAGPGRLDVQAGGTINLGTSEGITTIGNLVNPALPAQGADVTVSAGIAKAPDYASFINTYIAQSDVYDDELIQYVEQLTGATDLDKAQALAALQAMPGEDQAPLLQQLLFDALRTDGRAAAAAGPDHGNFTSAFNALEALFPGGTAAKAQNDPYSGDILLYFSKVYTVGGGDINLLAPGGQINVGLAVAPTAFGITKAASDLGIVAEQQGSINMVSYGDIDVNQSRVFAADGGNILMWSTQGNIDAGRGARSAISAPPPTITIDPATGLVKEVFPDALTGSGIQALSTTPGVSPGAVDLFAPHGVVNANEAGIVAGNITIYAVQVLGTNNISFSGTAVGVPVAVTGVGASLSAASSSGAAASGVGESSVAQSSSSQNQAPQAQAALNWLDVFVLGLGEAQCAPDDLECIKKQQIHP
ncbi:MAG TPA: filamentous hemagglutinin family protein [Steroidobacteraceae bacterium]|nr:filamentous hemagglutinin family protein [Steroidobacteraceae bacterium]